MERPPSAPFPGPEGKIKKVEPPKSEAGFSRVHDVSLSSFNRASTLPHFKKPEATPEEKKYKITAVDFVGIPAEITKDEETFRTWFEPRFGSLSTEQDLERVSKSIWEAIKVLEEKPYLLSPRRDGGMGLSRKVKKDIGFQEKINPEKEKALAKGLFKEISDVLAFFRKVAIDTKKNPESIISPERKNVKGAERLSICRILSIAYVLEVIRNNQDFENFFKNARAVIQKNPLAGDSRFSTGKLSQESGVLPIMEAGELDILDDPGEEFRLLDWLGREQVIKNATLLINNRVYSIPEVRVGVKGGLRAFLKVLRDPKAENLGALDDFFRMTFVFPDDTHTEGVLGLLQDIEAQAKSKKDTAVSVEFRSKNYFSPEELEDHFPNVLEEEKRATKSAQENTTEEDLGIDETTVVRSGALEKIKIHQNPSSGQSFKNISMKINLRRPGQKESVKPFFSFEVQVLREKELAGNQNLEWSASHFTIEMRQAIWAISRMNGKLKEEEITEMIKSYLIKEVETKKIPDKLVGQEILEVKGEKGKMTKIKKGFELNFRGTIEEQARKLFDFMVREKVLKKTTVKFPEVGKPTDQQKTASLFFVHRDQMDKLLGLIGAKTAEE